MLCICCRRSIMADRNTIQNLIPLICIRPLRLCFHPEQLRSARIVVLRVTHSPFVAAIWAYERGYRYFTRKKSPQTPTFLARQTSHPPILSRQASFRGAALRSDLSLAKAARIHTGKRVRRATSADTTNDSIAELKQLIETLSAQVQELKASIARRSDE